LKNFGKRYFNIKKFRIYVYDSTLFYNSDWYPGVIISLKYDSISDDKKRIFKDSLKKIFHHIKTCEPLSIQDFKAIKPKNPNFLLFFSILTDEILEAEIVPLVDWQAKNLYISQRKIICDEQTLSHMPRLHFWLLFNKKNEIIKWFTGVSVP
jgi:hypothetical protein